MDDATLVLLADTLNAQPAAALATLHGGEPAVSMVPCAWLPDGRGVIHVSRLATHTADLLAHDRVALLVTAPAHLADTPLALPRVSLQGTASVCSPDQADHAVAREAYLARFADAEPLFGFGDFALVLVAPLHVRFVGGFGRAHAVPLPVWQRVCGLSGQGPLAHGGAGGA